MEEPHGVWMERMEEDVDGMCLMKMEMEDGRWSRPCFMMDGRTFEFMMEGRSNFEF